MNENIKVILDKKIKIYLNITTVKDIEQYGINFDIVYDTPFINCFFRNKLFDISLNREISLNENIDDIFDEQIVFISVLTEFGDFDISVEDLNLNTYNINNLKNKFGNNIKNKRTILFSKKSKKISFDYKNSRILLLYYIDKLSEIYIE